MNQRERFEAWAKDQGWSVKCFNEHNRTMKGYQSVTTRIGWKAFQEAERQTIERCAKVCESRYMGDNNREDMEAKRCAAAIRALGGGDASE